MTVSQHFVYSLLSVGKKQSKWNPVHSCLGKRSLVFNQRFWCPLKVNSPAQIHIQNEMLNVLRINNYWTEQLTSIFKIEMWQGPRTTVLLRVTSHKLWWWFRIEDSRDFYLSRSHKLNEHNLSGCPQLPFTCSQPCSTSNSFILSASIHCPPGLSVKEQCCSLLGSGTGSWALTKRRCAPASLGMCNMTETYSGLCSQTCTWNTCAHQTYSNKEGSRGKSDAIKVWYRAPFPAKSRTSLIGSDSNMKPSPWKICWPLFSCALTVLMGNHPAC